MSGKGPIPGYLMNVVKMLDGRRKMFETRAEVGGLMSERCRMYDVGRLRSEFHFLSLIC